MNTCDLTLVGSTITWDLLIIVELVVVDTGQTRASWRLRWSTHPAFLATAIANSRAIANVPETHMIHPHTGYHFNVTTHQLPQSEHHHHFDK